MKRKKILCALVLLIASGCRAKTADAGCDVADGTKVCFDIDANHYKIEENARITLGGLPASYGDALVALWNETYPEHAGMLEVKYNHDVSSAIAAVYASYDIVFTYEELSGAYQSNLYPLDENLLIDTYPTSYTAEKTWKDLFKKDESVHEEAAEPLVLSAIQPYYLPIAYEGAAFFYNKTMLESLGIDTELDANEDGMPDRFETWEQIFSLADAWAKQRPVYRKKPVNIVFPFSLNENYLSYFMFTSQGFRLFPDHDGMNPGFQSDTFAKALQFITEARKHPMAVKDDGTPYLAGDYVWQWEKVYTQQIAPFGVVAPWMDLKGAAKANKAEYVVTSRFPTFMGTSMVPFVTTMGYVLRSDTKYPSAAHEVLAFLKSEAAMQLLIEESPLVPYRYDGQQLDFTQDPNRQAIQSTLAEADSQPIIALPNNRYKKALDGYYEIPFMDVIRRLWDEVIDPFQAQNELQFHYQKWFFENTDVQIPKTTSSAQP